MTAECSVSIIAEVTGLGKREDFAEKFSVSATIIKAATNRQIQAEGGTDEALELCGISTVELIIVKATANDLLIDSDYEESFDADIIIPEGEVRIIKPSGVVRIKNEDDSEACTLDYLIIGSA